MDFKTYFEIPNNITYVNTPGNGLLPIAHHQWRREREECFFDPKGDLRDQQVAFNKQVKVEFGQLFNCDINRLFLTPNFSFGFNTLLEGLNKSLKFLLIEDEYPSLNYPIVSRGFSCSFLPNSADVEEQIYHYVRDNDVDVLVLSLVNYINGLKIDLNFIKRLKKDYPKLLILGDATQYLGTEPFDFACSGFDAVGGSGYKWLMAGFGNGYMMISEQLSSILYAEANKLERPKEAMWAHKEILNIYFEPGHQDTLSHGTLGESVKFLNEIGLVNVKSYLDDLLRYAYRIFEDKGWLLPLVSQREIKSAVINLQVDPNIYPKLLDKGVKCFPRGTGIRIGLHIYNTKEDINRLVEIIESIDNEY